MHNGPHSKRMPIERSCRQCGSSFIVAIPSDPKTFCNRSCAASFNCVGRVRSPESRSRTAASRLAYIAKHGNYPNRKGREFPDLTNIKRATCTHCRQPFWSKRQRRVDKNYTTTCSDNCFIAVKKANATGIKRVEYQGFQFDSQWEVEVAKRLEAASIQWIRPIEAIRWVDDKGRERRYYADFFIPDLNLYLDPKNPLVIKRQNDKLIRVSRIIDLIYGHPDDIIDVVMKRWRSREDSNLQ